MRFPHLSLADLRNGAEIARRDAAQSRRHGDAMKARNALRKAAEFEAEHDARVAALPVAA